MATENEKTNLDITETFGKAESYFQQNKKVITYVLGGIALAVAGYFSYQIFVAEPNEKQAQAEMFTAEKYFEQDSLKKAINGDGQHMGFKQVIENFGSTKAGNLAHYYLGISYMKTGKFKEAIEELEDFDANDEVVKPIAMGAMGDCYTELGEVEKGITHYLEASQAANNKFISPVYMMKAALSYESLNKFADAAEVYKEIKKNYFDTNEGREADKYIARAQSMIK